MNQRTPTRRQLRYLADLYRQLEREPPTVSTRAGASAAIDNALRRLQPARPAPAEPAPLAHQLHDIAVLSRRLGVTAPHISTRGEASALLARLQKGQSEQP